MHQVLNFGSLNIDFVYRVDHFVSPGETLAARSLARHAGGNGLNQSVALAKAGVRVAHAGKIGQDGGFLRETLAQAGVETGGILVCDVPTGHACIQVEEGSGQNSILLFPGANVSFSEREILSLLDRFPARWLLLQNEINMIPFLMKEARRRGMKIAVNPAPCTPEVPDYPLDFADLLFVNEIEAGQIAGIRESPERTVELLAARYPRQEILMTLGKEGACYACGTRRHRVAAGKVRAVDTTCAGDTFNGFFLAARLEGADVPEAMDLAARAAAIAVTRPGAAESIPVRGEL